LRRAAADLVAYLAQRLTSTGPHFVVENRGGAGGVIGADMVAKAPRMATRW
jgi:tripartite-type tricarboxylate transporter receptor subunit TctC